MKTLPLLALAALLSIPTAQAQRSNTRGFLLEGSLYGTGLDIEGDDAGGGGGLGLRVGYGVSQLVTLYLGLGGAALEPEDPVLDLITDNDDIGLGYADLGVEFNFGSSRNALRPFANVALSGAALAVDPPGNDNDAAINGGGLTFGGGLRYFVSPVLALKGSLRLGGGEFSEAEVDGDEVPFENAEFGTGRLHVGLSWFPMR